MSEFNPFGTGFFNISLDQRKAGVLSTKFILPPFSVLNARDGAWQERKRAWIRLGIRSELGRGENVTWHIDCAGNSANRKHVPGGSLMPAADYSNGNRRDSHGRIIPSKKKGITNGVVYAFGNKEVWAKKKKQKGGLLHAGDTIDTKNGETWDGGRPAWRNEGTSVFDPVLCELCYRWFCPSGGQVIDPFAGGSVRGIVAGLLGYKYWGCELSKAQVQANILQREEIAPESDIKWVVGDSTQKLKYAPKADFLFSCPPYGDLERYSDNPADISTMDYSSFLIAYAKIIRKAALRLKDGGMACFVVGDFRDRKTGNYRGFVVDTIFAFRQAGLYLYNDAILVTAVGSLPVRVVRQFESKRKLGKTHQNVLVFVRGQFSGRFGKK